MSALQWALLLLGVGIAGLLIWTSRREKRAAARPPPSQTRPATRDWGASPDLLPEPAPPPPRPAPRRAELSFDDLGVGKPRRKVAPDVGPGGAAIPEKVIGFYIAEHEGTNILGPKIHAALAARGLQYGARRIYHRLEGDQPVFSVASLVKPGTLDPAESEGFATPGLSMFMLLPGPAQPVAAFQDMLDTARNLARALNAELYDTEQRAPLTPERERALHEQVEEWARRHGPRADA